MLFDFIVRTLLVYYILNKYNGERVHLFTHILLLNVISTISKNIYRKHALKKEMLIDECIKVCIIFTSQVLTHNILCYYDCKNNIVNATLMSLCSFITVYFLDKNYIFSQN